MVFKIDVPTSLILGDVDEGYGPLADQFRRNFAERGEVGAACAVYKDGRKVPISFRRPPPAPSSAPAPPAAPGPESQQ